MKIKTRPTRNAWLESLYEAGLVKADENTRRLGDKLYFIQQVYSFLGLETWDYFVESKNLSDLVFLDGQMLPPAQISEHIRSFFPEGFVIKPKDGINSWGRSPGFYFEEKSFLDDLQSERVPPIEQLMIQTNCGPLLGTAAVTGSQQLSEVRIHTYENYVIDGGQYHRWAESPVKDSTHFRRAQILTQNLLQKLPTHFLENQAWSLDILVGANQARIVDVNTNRGLRGHWSGFLSRPRLIGAYSRHFEKHKGVRFVGFAGLLLRTNLASYHKYLKKTYIEGIR